MQNNSEIPEQFPISPWNRMLRTEISVKCVSFPRRFSSWLRVFCSTLEEYWHETADHIPIWREKSESDSWLPPEKCKLCYLWILNAMNSLVLVVGLFWTNFLLAVLPYRSRTLKVSVVDWYRWILWSFWPILLRRFRVQEWPWDRWDRRRIMHYRMGILL